MEITLSPIDQSYLAFMDKCHDCAAEYEIDLSWASLVVSYRSKESWYQEGEDALVSKARSGVLASSIVGLDVLTNLDLEG